MLFTPKSILVAAFSALAASQLLASPALAVPRDMTADREADVANTNNADNVAAPASDPVFLLVIRHEGDQTAATIRKLNEAREAERKRKAEAEAEAARAATAATNAANAPAPVNARANRHTRVNHNTRTLAATRGSAQPAAPLGPMPDFGDDVANCLEAHNRERRAVGFPDLVWDQGLAQSAMTAAQRQLGVAGLAHTNYQAINVGENLALNGDYKNGLTSAVKQFCSAHEKHQVHVLGQTNHYSQVIWPTTQRVGCAKVASGRMAKIACHYSPPGNNGPVRFGARRTA